MDEIIIRFGMDGLWQKEIFWGMCLCVIMIAWKFRSLFSVLWAYVLLCCLYHYEAPVIQWGSFDSAFIHTAGRVFSEVLLITIAIWAFPQKVLHFLFNSIAVIELYMLYQHGSGLFIAPSFDLAFLALWTCFSPWYIGLPIFGMIATHHGSTASLIICASLFPYILKKGWKWKMFVVIGVLGWMINAYMHSTGPHLDGNERLTYYAKFMHYWWDSHNSVPFVYHSDWPRRLFGTHPGSLIWLSTALENFRGTIFLQMHSDWLQVLFELGVVGFALVFAVFVQSIYIVRKDPQLLGAVLGVGAFMLPYHPLRFEISALLCVYIARRVWENKYGRY